AHRRAIGVGGTGTGAADLSPEGDAGPATPGRPRAGPQEPAPDPGDDAQSEAPHPLGLVPAEVGVALTPLGVDAARPAPLAVVVRAAFHRMPIPRSAAHSASLLWIRGLGGVCRRS